MRIRVRVWLTRDLQFPWWVKAGERIWKARTEPVGRRFARYAVPLKVFRMAFCVGVFVGFSIS